MLLLWIIINISGNLPNACWACPRSLLVRGRDWPHYTHSSFCSNHRHPRAPAPPPLEHTRPLQHENTSERWGGECTGYCLVTGGGYSYVVAASPRHWGCDTCGGVVAYSGTNSPKTKTSVLEHCTYFIL